MFCVVAGMSLEEVREFEKQLQQETNKKIKDDMSNSGSISKPEKKDLERGGREGDSDGEMRAPEDKGEDLEKIGGERRMCAR